MSRKPIQATRDEMLYLREQGYSNKGIAEALGISAVTVTKYIGNRFNRTDEERKCQYCGGKIGKFGHLCSHCYEKRRLIRKIKRMLIEGMAEVQR